MRASTGSPTSWRTRNDPFQQFWIIIFSFVCLLFIFFSVSTQRQHRIQAPLCAPLTPLPRLFLSTPSSCFLFLLVRTLGALACAACVCACGCGCVCLCGCVGVKASLCMLAGIGSNPGVPFTHLLWNQQSGFQGPPPSLSLSIHQTQSLPCSAYPPPHLICLARPPHLDPVLPRPYSSEEARFSYGKERARVQPPTPPCRIYLCWLEMPPSLPPSVLRCSF